MSEASCRLNYIRSSTIIQQEKLFFFFFKFNYFYDWANFNFLGSGIFTVGQKEATAAKLLSQDTGNTVGMQCA